MKNRNDFLTRIVACENVYFLNEYEQAVIRTTDEKNIFYVKFKGKDEFEQKPVDGRLNKIITDALLQEVELTLTEYENF